MAFNNKKLLDIPNKGQKVPFIMFLRHAERDFSEDPLEDIKKQINGNGKKQAISLGKELLKRQSKICFIKSSPIERCVETANAILEGARSNVKVLTSRILGDPGPFVSDDKIAFQTFLELGIEEIVRRQHENKPIPGFHDTKKGLKTLLEEFVKDMEKLDGVGLYISHDAIIAAFLGYLTGTAIDMDNWIGFLDGVLIYKTSDKKYFLLSKEKKHEITHEIKNLLNET